MSILLLILIFWIINTVYLAMLFNSMIYKKNQVDNAFASIDVLLQKRCDLIPNLVAVAQNYMQFEHKILTEIAKLRARAVSGRFRVNTRVTLENQISKALDTVIVAVEAYPELKTNEHFTNSEQKVMQTWAQQFLPALLLKSTAPAEVLPKSSTKTQTQEQAVGMRFKLKSLNEFKNFYQQNLLSDLQAIEKTRKEVLTSIFFPWNNYVDSIWKISEHL